LSLAIDNGPSCVAAGPEKAVEAFERQLRSKRILSMRVNTPHAGHSSLMEPVAKAFEAEVRKITFDPPQIPYISNLTGQWITTEEIMNPLHWSRHLCSCVRFGPGIRQLVKRPDALFIEVGPGRDLSLLIDRYLDKNSGQRSIHLVRPEKKVDHDQLYLMNRLGRFWLFGGVVNWNQFHPGINGVSRPKRISLPTYPFEPQKYPSGALDIGKLLSNFQA
ncbi:MAG: acyltransferase domain-containing protein, partial [bacterium]|nr:acyltransferase domain-containing protein [bacterium]